MSKNNVRTWIVLSIGLSLGVAPFLVRGDQATRDRLEQNRQAISSMTQSERDRLDRNFEAYQLMDAQEISTLKAFHQELIRDSELISVLDQYHAWLETIEPYQRDELKETTNPQERIAKMHEFIGEQRARDAARFLHSAFRNMKDDRWTRMWVRMLSSVPILSESDFSNLMEGLEKNESPNFTAIDRAKLKELESLNRYLFLLDLIKSVTNVRSPDAKRLDQIVLPQLQPAFEKLERTFDSFVESSKAKEFVSRNRGGKMTPPASLRIQGIILKSLLVHAAAQRQNAEVVSRSELQKFFDDLAVEVQDELLELESIDFYKELMTQERATRETLDSFDMLRPFLSKSRYEELQKSRHHSASARGGGFNGEGHRRPEFRNGDGPPGGGRPRGSNDRGPGERPPRPGDRDDDGSPRDAKRGPGGRLDPDGKPLFPRDGSRRPNGKRPGPPPRPREEAGNR